MTGTLIVDVSRHLEVLMPEADVEPSPTIPGAVRVTGVLETSPYTLSLLMEDKFLIRDYKDKGKEFTVSYPGGFDATSINRTTCFLLCHGADGAAMANEVFELVNLVVWAGGEIKGEQL